MTNPTAQIMRQKDAIEALEKRLRVATDALRGILEMDTEAQCVFAAYSEAADIAEKALRDLEKMR